MRRSIFLILLCASAAMRCAGGNPVAPGIQPTSLTPLPTPTPPPAPTPGLTFSEPFTQLSPGQTVSRHVSANGPECVGLPGWNCHFFRVSAPSDGTLDLHLSWVLETQPSQPLDLSVEESDRTEHWSNYGPGQSHLRLHVIAGRIYQVTIWYMLIGVDYELQSSLQPE